MTLYETALKMAATAHREQVRKHDGSPYIVHPVMVARILEQYGFEEKVVAAGLVHDVLEDSDIDEAELRKKLGDAVVDTVTKVSENTDLAWEDRKEAYAKEVAAGSDEVKAVSVADKIHNAQNLIAHAKVVGSDIWKNFNRGKDLV